MHIPTTSLRQLAMKNQVRNSKAANTPTTLLRPTMKQLALLSIQTRPTPTLQEKQNTPSTTRKISPPVQLTDPANALRNVRATGARPTVAVRVETMIRPSDLGRALSKRCGCRPPAVAKMNLKNLRTVTTIVPYDFSDHSPDDIIKKHLETAPITYPQQQRKTKAKRAPRLISTLK